MGSGRAQVNTEQKVAVWMMVLAFLLTIADITYGIVAYVNQ